MKIAWAHMLAVELRSLDGACIAQLFHKIFTSSIIYLKTGLKPIRVIV